LHHPSTDEGALDVFVKVFTGDPGPRPEALMPKIDLPLLLLWGEKDPWTPANGPVAKYFMKLAGERDNLFVETLPDVGHCPHDDRPELAAGRIHHFLRTFDL
jgi:pimeloyl-ACP methyl ester carboxylesterase